MQSLERRNANFAYQAKGVMQLAAIAKEIEMHNLENGKRINREAWK